VTALPKQEPSLRTSVLWRCWWNTPDPEGKRDTQHTVYVAAPSLAAAARVVQSQVVQTLGDFPETWPRVEFAPQGDVTWEDA
jgi:hypothetical protein